MKYLYQKGGITMARDWHPPKGVVMHLKNKRERLRIRYLKGKKMCKLFSMEPDRHVIGILGTTPHRCSCTMCGNPRYHFNQVTFQERRFKDSAKIQIKEANTDWLLLSTF